MKEVYTHSSPCIFFLFLFLGGQGSLNHSFWGESNKQYGNFAGFTPKNCALLGVGSQILGCPRKLGSMVTKGVITPIHPPFVRIGETTHWSDHHWSVHFQRDIQVLTPVWVEKFVFLVCSGNRYFTGERGFLDHLSFLVEKCQLGDFQASIGTFVFLLRSWRSCEFFQLPVKSGSFFGWFRNLPIFNTLRIIRDFWDDRINGFSPPKVAWSGMGFLGDFMGFIAVSRSKSMDFSGSRKGW